MQIHLSLGYLGKISGNDQTIGINITVDEFTNRWEVEIM